MAISKTLELKDSFSSVLDRFVSKIKKAVEGEKELESSVQKLERRQLNSTATVFIWNQELSSMAEKLGESASKAEIATAAFQKLMKNWEAGDKLAGYHQDFLTLYGDIMTEAGYSWTSLAEGHNKVELAAKNSISALEEAGYIIQKTTEEIEEQEETLPVWAQNWLKVKGVFAPIGETFKKFVDHAKKTGDETEKAAKKGHRAFDGLGKKLLSIGALFFTARKLVQYFRQALERAPDNLLKPYEKLKENIRNLFDRSAVSGLAAMQDGLQRLNELMASPAGQKFADVMARVGYIIGSVVGGGINLLLDLIGLVIDAFGQMGLSADQVISFIAGIASALYVTLYNIVASVWNIVASFAEFLYNTFTGRATLGQAITTFFWRIADTVLGYLQALGDGIDWLLGKLGVTTGLGGFVGGLRSGAQSNLNDALAAQGANAVVFDRMELKDYGTTAEEWAGKAGSFDPMSLQLKAINRGVGSIAKSASSIDKSLQEADIKALLDVAERKFVSMVNLTSQTPVVTVNGANTGNTQQDRINLANTIRDILLEQLAIGSTTSSAYGV